MIKTQSFELWFCWNSKTKTVFGKLLRVSSAERIFIFWVFFKLFSKSLKLCSFFISVVQFSNHFLSHTLKILYFSMIFSPWKSQLFHSRLTSKENQRRAVLILYETSLVSAQYLWPSSISEKALKRGEHLKLSEPVHFIVIRRRLFLDFIPRKEPFQKADIFSS